MHGPTTDAAQPAREAERDGLAKLLVGEPATALLIWHATATVDDTTAAAACFVSGAVRGRRPGSAPAKTVGNGRPRPEPAAAAVRTPLPSTPWKRCALRQHRGCPRRSPTAP